MTKRTKRRMSSEDRAELNAIMNAPMVVSESALKIRSELQADLAKRRARDQRAIARKHPNWGRRQRPVEGFWVWDEEVQPTLEEAMPSNLPHGKLWPLETPTTRRQLKHMQRVAALRFEKGLQQSAERELTSSVDRWDRAEWRDIEREIDRRWVNAQQRIRKRAKRLAKSLKSTA